MAEKTMTEMMRKGLEKGMPTQEDVNKWKKTKASSDMSIRGKTSRAYAKKRGTISSKTGVTKADIEKWKKMSKKLDLDAKRLLVKNPSMTKTALKAALRVGTKAIPAALAASLIAEAAMYAYEHRTSGPTTDPAERKASRHGKKSIGGKVNMTNKRTNKQLGGFASAVGKTALGSLTGDSAELKAYNDWKTAQRGDERLGEESDESKRKRQLERRRKRATSAKNIEVAMEEKGRKLPKSAFKSKKAKEEVWKTIGKAIEGWTGKKGGGKVYTSQNKKYGGGVYPRRTKGEDI